MCGFCTPTYEQLPRGEKVSHISVKRGGVTYSASMGDNPAHQSDVMGTMLMSRLGNPSPFSLSTLALRDVLRMVFSPDWRWHASRVFRRSRRQIGRWCSGDTRLPIWAIRRIERLIVENMNVEQWRRAKLQDIEDEARARLALTQSALSACKLLRARAERDPPAKVGRPRKKAASPLPLRAARVTIPEAPHPRR